MRHMMLQGVRPARVPQAHFRSDLSGIQDLRVRQAAHFIEQRIDNPPPLDAIARYVGVGRRQLERAFRLATGLSPMAFQRQLRLEYGCWLLLNKPSSITQVALDCGFADGAHFRATSARILAYPRVNIRNPGGRRARTRFHWRSGDSLNQSGFAWRACRLLAGIYGRTRDNPGKLMRFQLSARLARRVSIL